MAGWKSDDEGHDMNNNGSYKDPDDMPADAFSSDTEADAFQEEPDKDE